MDTHTSLHTSLENCKLSSYYFATRWAIASLKERIENVERYGFSAKYDRYQLEQLEDMETWLQESWDAWMERMTGIAVQEVSRG